MMLLRCKNIKTLVLIDIDNTLADTYVRLRHTEVINSYSLFAIYSTLDPYHNNIEFINSLSRGLSTRSVILTARNYLVRFVTISWLKKTTLVFSNCYHSNNLKNKLYFFKIGLLFMDELIIFDDFSESGEKFNEPLIDQEMLTFVNSNNRIRYFGLKEIIEIRG